MNTKKLAMSAVGLLTVLTLTLVKAPVADAATCTAMSTSWPGGASCPGTTVNENKGWALGETITVAGGIYNVGQKIVKVQHWAASGGLFLSRFSSVQGVNSSGALISNCYTFENTQWEMSIDGSGCENAVRIKLFVKY